MLLKGPGLIIEEFYFGFVSVHGQRVGPDLELVYVKKRLVCARLVCPNEFIPALIIDFIEQHLIRIAFLYQPTNFYT